MLKHRPNLPQTYWVKVKWVASVKSNSRVWRAHCAAKYFPARRPCRRQESPNPGTKCNSRSPAGPPTEQSAQDGPSSRKKKRVKLASIEADTVPEGHYRVSIPSEVAKLSRAIDRALGKQAPVAARTHRPPRAPPPTKMSTFATAEQGP